MTSPEISVAVIGAGMAGRSHANGYRQAGTVFSNDFPKVRLAAIADAHQPLAEDAATRYNYEKVYTDWRQVADDPTIDAVSVVVGNALHREIAEGLVHAGKHVLCEKPLAGTLEDARAMVELERNTELVTSVGYTVRRTPAVAAIEDAVRQGAFGELSTFEATYHADYSCDPQAPMSWRYKGGPGSGALGDLGSHLIDTSEFLCGPIVSVQGATFSTHITERPLPLGNVVGHELTAVSEETEPVENEDTAVFVATFANGAVGTYTISRVTFGHPNYQGFALNGTSARAAWNMERPSEYLYADSAPDPATQGTRHVIASPHMPYFGGGHAMDAPGVGYGYNENFIYQARAFLDQVVESETPLPQCATFAEALHTMEIIDAVARSAQQNGAKVEVRS